MKLFGRSAHRLTLVRLTPKYRIRFSTEGGGDAETAESSVKTELKLPPGYDPHQPPACAAWDLNCPTWRSNDRGVGLIR